MVADSGDLWPYLEPQLAVKLLSEGALKHDNDGHQKRKSDHHQPEPPKCAALPALCEVTAAGLQLRRDTGSENGLS
jgi:hypothetical protein